MTSCIIDLNTNIVVFPHATTCSNWNNLIVTHQGHTNVSAKNVVPLELERITFYTKKGNIKAAEIILDFLEYNLKK